MKAYYGRSVDMRDPFEKERYREWENYRELCEKYYKGYAAGVQPRPLLNRDNFSPERFGPPGLRRENSPYIRGRRDDYPGGLGHRNRNIGGGGYSEKMPGREGHSVKDMAKLKEKEPENPPGDGKGNKHKKHRRRRKGEEGEGFPTTDVPEGSRKPRETAAGEDSKPDPLFILPSRDDATPVRDEPMEADSVAFKPLSDKERKEKPKAKVEKTKRKVEGTPTTATPTIKKEAPVKLVKAPQEKVDVEHEKSPRASDLPAKKVKEDLSKAEGAKPLPSQKDEKQLGTPRKVHPRGTKEHSENRPVKEEKVKKEHPKEIKPEKPSSKEEKSKKPVDKSKPADTKAEKRKRKVEDKVDRDHEATSQKASKQDVAELKPSPKGKAEPEGEKVERTPEKDKTVSPVAPAKKIKLNRETGKKIVSAENIPPVKELPSEKSEPTSSKAKQEKTKGKLRRKIAAADGSGSTLVDYTRYRFSRWVRVCHVVRDAGVARLGS